MTKPAPINSPVTDVPGTALYLSVSEASVRRLIRDGVIPITKVGGKAKSRIRVLVADLDRLLESGYRPATAGPLGPRSLQAPVRDAGRHEVCPRAHTDGVGSRVTRGS